MEKINSSYEIMFIVNLANGEEAAKATVNKFVGLIKANAEVIRVDEWGRRRLAYPIEDLNEGYYTVAVFQSAGDFPAEIQRLMTIDETVMRVMVIKLEEAALKAAVAAPVEEKVEEAAPAVEEAAPAVEAAPAPEAE